MAYDFGGELDIESHNQISSCSFLGRLDMCLSVNHDLASLGSWHSFILNHKFRLRRDNFIRCHSKGTTIKCFDF